LSKTGAPAERLRADLAERINACRFIDVRKASALYRLLGDEARLRLLRVLGRERLNVTELTRIVGLAQSGVSRHLGMLKDAGLVSEEKDAGYTYFRLAPALSENGQGALWAALQEQFAAAARDTAVLADEARLQEVLRLRKENFESHVADARDARQFVPGRSWAAWSRALGLLLPPLTVADLGCGDGYLAVEASRWAAQVIAVDRSNVVLDRARELGARRRVSNVVWKRGELEKLPIKDAAVDVALLSQALHHAANPARAVAEAARITVPGGRVLVLDLREHGEEWVREKLGDRHLGFSDEKLKTMLIDAGLRDARVGVGARKVGDPFTVLIASGQKPPLANGTIAKE
jgi:SAM-dependent methyltransferase